MVIAIVSVWGLFFLKFGYSGFFYVFLSFVRILGLDVWL